MKRKRCYLNRLLKNFHPIKLFILCFADAIKLQNFSCFRNLAMVLTYANCEFNSVVWKVFSQAIVHLVIFWVWKFEELILRSYLMFKLLVKKFMWDYFWKRNQKSPKNSEKKFLNKKLFKFFHIFLFPKISSNIYSWNLQKIFSNIFL